MSEFSPTPTEEAASQRPRNTREKPVDLEALKEKKYASAALVPTMDHLSTTVASVVAMFEKGVTNKFVFVADTDKQAMVDIGEGARSVAELAKIAVRTVNPDIPEGAIEIISRPNSSTAPRAAVEALLEYNREDVANNQILFVDASGNDKLQHAVNAFGYFPDRVTARSMLLGAGVSEEKITTREKADEIEDNLRREGKLVNMRDENLVDSEGNPLSDEELTKIRKAKAAFAGLNLGTWSFSRRNPGTKDEQLMFAPANPGNVPKENYGLAVLDEPVTDEKLLRELNSPKKIDGLNVFRAGWRGEEKASADEIVTVFSPLYGNWNGKHAKNNLAILESSEPGSAERANLIEDECTQRVRKLAEIKADQDDHKVVAIDYPFMGSSPKFKEYMELFAKHDYAAIARRELAVLEKLGVKRVNLTGQSMGAFASLEMARYAKEFGITVENIVLFEIPMPMKTTELMQRELKEFEVLGLQHSHPPDVQLAYGSKIVRQEEPSLLDTAKEGVEMAFGMITNDPLFRYAATMAHNDVAAKVQKFLADSPESRVVFVNGSESTISPLNEIKGLVNDVRIPKYAEHGWTIAHVHKIMGSKPEEYKKEKDIIREINSHIKVTQFPGYGHIGMVNPDVNAKIFDIVTRKRKQNNQEPMAA